MKPNNTNNTLNEHVTIKSIQNANKIDTQHDIQNNINATNNKINNEVKLENISTSVNSFPPNVSGNFRSDESSSPSLFLNSSSNTATSTPDCTSPSITYNPVNLKRKIESSLDEIMPNDTEVSDIPNTLPEAIKVSPLTGWLPSDLVGSIMPNSIMTPENDLCASLIQKGTANLSAISDSLNGPKSSLYSESSSEIAALITNKIKKQNFDSLKLINPDTPVIKSEENSKQFDLPHLSLYALKIFNQIHYNPNPTLNQPTQEERFKWDNCIIKNTLIQPSMPIPKEDQEDNQHIANQIHNNINYNNENIMDKTSFSNHSSHVTDTSINNPALSVIPKVDSISINSTIDLLNSFNNFIEDVFEADDEFNEDSTEKNLFWISYKYSPLPLLSFDCLDKIDAFLRRIIATSSLEKIDNKVLVRLQSLFQKPLENISLINYKNIQELSDTEVHKRLGLGYNAALALRNLLRVFAYHRPDGRYCYGETTILSVLDYFRMMVEDFLIPFSNDFCESNTISSLNTEDNYNFCIKLSNVTLTILSLISTISASCDLSEATISKIEFPLFSLFFTHNNHYYFKNDKRHNAIHLESLILGAMDTICSLFTSYPDQRTFIIEEILSSIEKVPAKKLRSGQYNLLHGNSIQYSSALILRLINICGTPSLFSERFSLSYVQDNEPNTKSIPDSVENFMEIYKDYIESNDKAINNSLQMAQFLSGFFVSRAAKLGDSYSSQGNLINSTSFKSLLEFFVRDFLIASVYPEWLSGLSLLDSITVAMINCADQSKFPANVNSLAFDILSKIANAVCTWKKVEPIPNTRISLDNSLELKNSLDARISILDYLEGVKKEDKRLSSSYDYYFSNLLYVLTQLAHKTTNSDSLKVIYDSLNYLFSMNNSMQNYTKSKVYLVTYRRLLGDSNLTTLYDRIVFTMIEGLSHNTIIARGRAIRAISLMMENDSDLLKRKPVEEALKVRLYDNSPLVRDASIEVLGKYITINRGLAFNFVKLFIDRSRDSAVSVRKRIIKILKNIYCLLRKETQKKVEIAYCLLTRVEDEDEGIRDLSFKSLQEIWLTVFQSDVSSLSTDRKERVEVMVGILVQDALKKRGRGTGAILLTNLLKKEFDNNLIERDKLLFSQLIEDTFSILLDKQSEVNQDKDPSTNKVINMVPFYLQLISIYGSITPKLFTQDHLYHYSFFLADEYANSKSRLWTIRIIRQVVPHIHVWRRDFLNEVQMNLLKNLTKYSYLELCDAIPCLWTISKLKADTIRIAKTTKSCFENIKSFFLQARSNGLKEVPPRLLKIIDLLGLLVRYCDLENHSQMFHMLEWLYEEEDKSLKNASKKKILTVTEMTINCLEVFCINMKGTGSDLLSSNVQKVAVRSLGVICIGHPNKFIEDKVLNLFKQIMNGNDSLLKNIIIRILTEFIETEKENSRLKIMEDADNKKNISSTKSSNILAERTILNNTNKSVKPKGDSSVDMNVLTGLTEKFLNEAICVPLLQVFMTSILQETMTSNDATAEDAVFLLRLIVEEGFGNPREYMPAIFALESSPNYKIRSIAHVLHAQLQDKCPSLIEGCYIDGIKQAYGYQISLKKSRHYAHRWEPFFLNHFYTTLHDLPATARKRLFMGIVRSFDFDLLNIDVCELYDDDKVAVIWPHLKYVRYLSLALKGLNFSSLDEVLLLLSGLDRLIARNGQLINKLAQSACKGKVMKKFELPTVSIVAACINYIWELRFYLQKAFKISEHTILDYSDAISRGIRGGNGGGIAKKQPNLVLTTDQARAECSKWSLVTFVNEEEDREICRNFLLNMTIVNEEMEMGSEDELKEKGINEDLSSERNIEDEMSAENEETKHEIINENEMINETEMNKENEINAKDESKEIMVERKVSLKAKVENKINSVNDKRIPIKEEKIFDKKNEDCIIIDDDSVIIDVEEQDSLRNNKKVITDVDVIDLDD